MRNLLAHRAPVWMPVLIATALCMATLQMAAEMAFGEGQQYKLDAQTVTLSHPDAQVALVSGQIKTKPDSWKGLFFPDVHALPGS